MGYIDAPIHVRRDRNYKMSNELDGDKIQEIIEKSRPVKGVVYPENKRVFLFAQKLKKVLADSPYQDLKPVVERYYDRWNNELLDNNGNNMSFDGVWAQFRYVWPKIRKGGALELAMEYAKESQKALPALNQYTDTNIHYLIRVCWELQQMQGDDPFFLTGEHAGIILGNRSQSYGYEILEMLIEDDVLKVVERGKKARATTYRFINNGGN
jgi:hypothetical protein